MDENSCVLVHVGDTFRVDCATTALKVLPTDIYLSNETSDREIDLGAAPPVQSNSQICVTHSYETGSHKPSLTGTWTHCNNSVYALPYVSHVLAALAIDTATLDVQNQFPRAHGVSSLSP